MGLKLIDASSVFTSQFKYIFFVDVHLLGKRYYIPSCSMKNKLKKKKAIEVNGIRKETRNLLFPEISFLN